MMGDIRLKVFIIWIVLTVIVINYRRFEKKSHIKKITNKVEAKGGNVIQIEEKHFSTKPFAIKPMGSRIYEIKYDLDDSLKIGWVRLGVMEKWKL